MPKERRVCPKGQHAGSKVIRKGFQTDDRGRVWQRYKCTPAPLEDQQSPHWFQELISEVEADHPVWQPPPRCPEHPEDGYVVRNGFYGSKKAGTARQKYRCTRKENGAFVAHFFAQTIPRKYVDDPTTKCPTCEDFLNIHHGSASTHRRTKWTLSAIVNCLRELSVGTSYAKASIGVVERTNAAVKHREVHEDGVLIDEPDPKAEDDQPEDEPEDKYAHLRPEQEGTFPFEEGITIIDPDALAAKVKTSSSILAEQGRNKWQIAAGICEQYAPLLFDHAEKTMKERETAARKANDRALSMGRVPETPLTFIMDEIPVFSRTRVGTTYRRASWSILAVSEILWRRPKKKGDPFLRENRLRLVRAYPSADTNAWRLMLAELGVRPDVVVADAGSAIEKAVGASYPPDTVVRIPSLFHFVRNLERAYRDATNATVTVNQKKILHDDLNQHIHLVSRDFLVDHGENAWHQWWDELEQLTRKYNIAHSVFADKRSQYEDDIAGAIGVLAELAHIPASNAGIELKNRMLLKPFLEGRSTRYANLARTNYLLSLAVCADQGLFYREEELITLIREDNAQYNGWAVPAREIADHQPRSVTQAALPSDKDPDINQDKDQHNEPEVEQEHYAVPRYRSLYDRTIVPVLVSRLNESRTGE